MAARARAAGRGARGRVVTDEEAAVLKLHIDALQVEHAEELRAVKRSFRSALDDTARTARELEIENTRLRRRVNGSPHRDAALRGRVDEIIQSLMAIDDPASEAPWLVRAAMRLCNYYPRAAATAFRAMERLNSIHHALDKSDGEFRDQLAREEAHAVFSAANCTVPIVRKHRPAVAVASDAEDAAE